jgi:hypothetical protein
MKAYKVRYFTSGIEIIQKLKKDFKNKQQVEQYSAAQNFYPKSFICESIITEKEINKFIVLNPEKL